MLQRITKNQPCIQAQTKNMIKNIYITGGFGFIGSNLVEYLNKKGIRPFVIEPLDKIGEKWKNVAGFDFNLLDISEVGKWNLLDLSGGILIHLGANVDTTEKMSADLWFNNVELSKKLFKLSFSKIIYASSAAVYGNSRDFVERIDGLKPLNAYAFTKLSLDRAVFGPTNPLEEVDIYGLRFFNVYDSVSSIRENHKKNMASLISKYKNIKNGQYKLFKYGEQSRDFIHVWDVCKVVDFFIENSPESGIYNVGTGKVENFNSLVDYLYNSQIEHVAQDAKFAFIYYGNQCDKKIEYIDMPPELKDQYQDYTCADITKLRNAGYKDEFISLRDGINYAK
jgi:ADP-L-glycero-D-manno-heptose 6-epimerase